MVHPTTAWVGRNGQVQFSLIGVTASLAVLRFGSGAGVPVLGPTTSVLPIRVADAQALPVEDAGSHLPLLGLASSIRKDAHYFPTTAAADKGSTPEVASEYSPSRLDRQSAQSVEFVGTKQTGNSSE